MPAGTLEARLGNLLLKAGSTLESDQGFVQSCLKTSNNGASTMSLGPCSADKKQDKRDWEKALVH